MGLDLEILGAMSLHLRCQSTYFENEYLAIVSLVLLDVVARHHADTCKGSNVLLNKPPQIFMLNLCWKRRDLNACGLFKDQIWSLWKLLIPSLEKVDSSVHKTVEKKLLSRACCSKNQTQNCNRRWASPGCNACTLCRWYGYSISRLMVRQTKFCDNPKFLATHLVLIWGLSITTSIIFSSFRKFTSCGRIDFCGAAVPVVRKRLNAEVKTVCASWCLPGYLRRYSLVASRAFPLHNPYTNMISAYSSLENGYISSTWNDWQNTNLLLIGSYLTATN